MCVFLTVLAELFAEGQHRYISGQDPKIALRIRHVERRTAHRKCDDDMIHDSHDPGP